MPKQCPRCSIILYSQHCEEGHKKLCNGKGHFGWYCSKCKHFTYKTQTFTSEDLKRTHKCGTMNCRVCRQLINVEEHHLCQLRKEKSTKFWPVIIFLNIEFYETNSNDCAACYELKLDFKETNNLTWKELFENKVFPSLSCKDHLNSQSIFEPLIINILKENRVNRGEFAQFTISRLFTNECENKFSFKYYDCIATPIKFLPCKSIPISLQTLKKKLEAQLENITYKFLHLLIDELWTNSTIVINDEDSMKMVLI